MYFHYQSLSSPLGNGPSLKKMEFLIVPQGYCAKVGQKLVYWFCSRFLKVVIFLDKLMYMALHLKKLEWLHAKFIENC